MADWRQRAPILTDRCATLREVSLEDGPSLLALLGTDDVGRFISPLPATMDEFERFVAWAHRQRAAGQYVCLSVIPTDVRHAVGLFQVRSIEPRFATGEWGFALAPAFWGTGLFVAAARLVLGFAFGTVRVRRLEARVSVHNGRGNGALRKLGATAEGLLRGSFVLHGQEQDQVLWSILESDWRTSAASRNVDLLIGSPPA
jgi:RimJ/RimL family protein N-acetyltransferase